MRILITRPIEDAKPLADALEERHVEVLIEPLLEIQHLEDAEINLQGVQALLFTSANGVRAFAALCPRRDLKAFTVGDGSAEAARQAGFGNVESAKGDVEALAALVVDRLKAEDGPLFHAAGTVTAGDLKTRLEGLGYQVRRAQLYEAKIASALSTETRANLTLGGIDAVLLFSPRTASTFADLWRAAGSPSLAGIHALCLSAAVAREIGNLGWAGVEIADRPDLPSMLALVDAARSKGAEMAEPSQRPEEGAPSADGAADSAAGADTAAARAASTTEARSARRPRTGGSILLYLVLMLIAAAAVVITAPLWQPQVGALVGLQPPSAPAVDDRIATLQRDVQALSEQVQAAIDENALQQAIEPINTDLNAVKQEVATLKSELERLRNAPGGTSTLSEGPSVNLAPIEERLSKLESALSDATRRINEVASAQGTAPSDSAAGAPIPEPDPRIDRLVSENDALKQQIASLTERLDQMADLDAKVGELVPRVDELGPRLDALDEQIASLPKSNEQQRAVALIVAVGELRSALASDKSFAAELATLNDLTLNDEELRPRLKPIVDSLTPMAEAGVPTLSQLAAGFPATEIARAGEAELAGQVTDDNWLKRFWRGLGHSISEVITVRPTGPDVEGDDTLAQLARAEAKLSEGDLAAAVSEVRAMTGLAAEAAAEWLAQAEARLTIEAAAAQLADISTRELAPRTTAEAAPASGDVEGAGN
ncbi:uroporphyrinogen-III synthase [Dongia deserti]|uniref:uroporphyrinogen-III synthase n=1 Tax=Dongia deserti TaxID=2268030 RepID=UPI000E64D587|nr:uroporphyrinogen-III synthase [Dongia deserti]